MPERGRWSRASARGDHSCEAPPSRGASHPLDRPGWPRDLSGVRISRLGVPEPLESRQRDPGPTRYLVIRNADTSFVYFSLQDGLLAPVPPEDSTGAEHDFSQSASLRGAEEIDLTGQGVNDPLLGTAHLGILNSPETRRAMLDFLADPSPRRHP